MLKNKLKLMFCALLCLLNMTVPLMAEIDNMDFESINVDDTPKVHISQIPNYTIVDLGTLETDSSTAAAINDNNQVLGTYYELGEQFFFLWDEAKGLRSFKLQDSIQDEDDHLNFQLLLNNKGQVAGLSHVYEEDITSTFLFLWDPEKGMIFEKRFHDSYLLMAGLSESGEILLIEGIWCIGLTPQLFWFDINGLHSIAKELTDEESEKFYKKYSRQDGYYIVFEIDDAKIIDLDENKVLFTLTCTFRKGWHDIAPPKRSSYFYDGEKVTPVQIEGADLNGRSLIDLDREGNMIVCDWNNEDTYRELYYISPKEGLEARLPNRHSFNLVNQRPVEFGHLEGDLRVDFNGNHYFTRGIKIKKLLLEEWPFYDVKNKDTTSINGHNASGWIVGEMNTIYPSNHAFLAFPKLRDQEP